MMTLKKPNEKIPYNKKILINSESSFAVREAYSKLRTSMMFCASSDSNKMCKVFAVTSPNSFEGKSVTAANIAISFAMLGKKTLLIDADLRRSSQSRIWKMKTSSGLSDFLAKIKPLNVIAVEGLPLSIVFSGTIPRDPAEILSLEKMNIFINECSNRFDYIIIDTPPINLYTDTQIISTFSDGILLVAKSGKTSADDLYKAEYAIKQVNGNLCGVVINDIKSQNQDSFFKNFVKNKKH